jgi:stage III sporulation protein AD
MDLLAVIGIGIVISIFSVLLKQYKPEYAVVLSVIGTVLVFSLILLELIPVFSAVRGMMESVSFASDYIKILIKCLGICYLTEIGSQICKESGQLALASKVELAGKVLIVVLALPMMQELLQIALDLIRI